MEVFNWKPYMHIVSGNQYPADVGALFAIRMGTPSIPPRQIQYILLPPLLPPVHLLARPHIDEVPMPWQGKLP